MYNEYRLATSIDGSTEREFALDLPLLFEIAV
jgi:hypothetical protein